MDIKARNDFPAIGTTLSSYKPNPSSGHNRHKSHNKRTKSVRKTLKHIFVLVIILAVLTGGYLGFKLYKNVAETFGGNIFDIFHSTKLIGESSGRVNILVAGNSADDPGHSGALLTDSIMLISLDTRDNTAFMLSVPRDLYVNIPGFGYNKINAAYEFGESENFSQNGYANGGMGLLEEIISQKFNIPIDYYALVNYEAFRDSVNAVGGITVNIQSSYPRGLYDPSIDYATGGSLVDLSNGLHTLDGEQALDLARARGDAPGSYGFANSDFERTSNQRMMLVALKDKALTVGVLSNPIKLGQLFDSLGKNVKTDLNLSDARRLYQISTKIPSNEIASDSLDNANGVDLLQSYTANDGESALAPVNGLNDYSAIDSYVSQITAVSAK
jgi:LCP family protein required for cell wall assembly